MRLRRRLLDYAGAGLRAVAGDRRVRAALERQPLAGSVWVCAIGKAAAAMARGAGEALGAAGCHGGLIVTKPGHGEADPADRMDGSEPIRDLQAGTCRLPCLEAGHPLPTAESLLAGARLLDELARLPPEITALFLISGGASSLVEVPAANLALADLVRLNDWLLASGLPIAAVNQVRQAVSRIKGGGLLAALGRRPARVLALSDVPGDRPETIGSGLLVPVPAAALTAPLAALDLPPWLRAWVAAGLAERARWPRIDRPPPLELVGSLREAMAGAAEAARADGWRVTQPPGDLRGDARAAGEDCARTLLRAPPGLVIWGGETTVRLPPVPGRGGRNQQLALAAAQVLDGQEGVALLSLGTDGSDGPTDVAGALVDGATLTRARAAGFEAAAALDLADAGSLLAATGDLVRTGPTGTNVMDLVLGWRA